MGINSYCAKRKILGPNVCTGSIASFERCRYVCFTPNYGRMTATQRTDASGQQATYGVEGNYGPLKVAEKEFYLLQRPAEQSVIC